MEYAASGAYAVGACIGAGGMGVVFHASHPATNAALALKRLRDDLADDPVVRARFATEIRAVKRFRHLNLVQHVDDGDGFFVMKLIAGMPLGMRIAEQGPFSLTRTAAIADQILRALAHAHARGVVHADVKSDNILVDSDDHATLIDFGVARLLDEATVLEDPMLSGTPDYMAPEVILGELPGPAADLYAVGVIVYEMLTGTTPFGGGTSAEVLARHVDDAVVPPSARLPDRTIPFEVERLVMRALAKDPWLRFPTAVAFGVALREAMHGVADDARASNVRARRRRSRLAGRDAAAPRP